MRAKKSLGQHFLKSERALRTIVETGHVGARDTVVEIGPGT
ncbi:MAG: ribosomal RNA small subunit methyltransferase A, partial [Candidatus Zambryskibacteria bacterium]|nr:ribosomal RNA small subunit methyltransferase A [Candidatus Zambryskibacteria bacterium]